MIVNGILKQNISVDVSREDLFMGLADELGVYSLFEESLSDQNDMNEDALFEYPWFESFLPVTTSPYCAYFTACFLWFMINAERKQTIMRRQPMHHPSRKSPAADFQRKGEVP